MYCLALCSSSIVPVTESFASTAITSRNANLMMTQCWLKKIHMLYVSETAVIGEAARQRKYLFVLYIDIL